MMSSQNRSKSEQENSKRWIKVCLFVTDKWPNLARCLFVKNFGQDFSAVCNLIKHYLSGKCMWKQNIRKLTILPLNFLPFATLSRPEALHLLSEQKRNLQVYRSGNNYCQRSQRSLIHGPMASQRPNVHVFRPNTCAKGLNGEGWGSQAPQEPFPEDNTTAKCYRTLLEPQFQKSKTNSFRKIGGQRLVLHSNRAILSFQVTKETWHGSNQIYNARVLLNRVQGYRPAFLISGQTGKEQTKL